MKTQELLELAALDALGLLDETERDAFDRAFRAAPPALQAQIRREQTRIAGDDSLLPKVETPMGLKARVLAAWHEAVAAVSNRSRARRFVGALTLLPSRGVNPWWRAGAIACAAASLVLAVGFFTIKHEFVAYTDATHQISQTDFFMKEFGPRFEDSFTSPGTQFVQFDPNDASVKAQAILLIDREGKSAQLFCVHLPNSVAGYALVALDENGRPVVDEKGEVKKICDVRERILNSGKAYQDRVAVPPGTVLGLVADDADSGETKLLLRGRSI